MDKRTDSADVAMTRERTDRFVVAQSILRFWYVLLGVALILIVILLRSVVHDVAAFHRGPSSTARHAPSTSAPR